MAARRALPRLGIVALLALSALGALPAPATDAVDPWRGQTLEQALQRLQGRGLAVLYSSDLVRPDMRVLREPTATTLHGILEQLLRPHGLDVRIGPGGRALVVRREAARLLVSLVSPRPDQAVFGRIVLAAEVVAADAVDRVEFLLDGRLVGTVRRPPYRLPVDVGEANVDRRFTAVAYGAWGASGSATVTTRRVAVEETVRVALKQLFVTVSRGSQRLLDLERQDFQIWDDGVEEKLVTFERGDVPITAVLLLDASESMRGAYLDSAMAGARAFLRRLRPLDEAMIVLFSDRTVAVTPFSHQAPSLLAGLDGIVAGGGTALNDHLYASLRLLDRRQGRRVVVLFSDGADVQSVLRMRQVFWKVRRTDALIYWIRLHTDGERTLSSAWRDADGHRQEWRGLEEAVSASGGRDQTLDGPDSIETAFTEIMAELRDQYVLGYYPTGRRHDGRWRPVRVSVGVSGVRVRLRDGYIDD